MVLTWQKPKFAPFEEQAQHEQLSTGVVLLERDDSPSETEFEVETPGCSFNVGESCGCFRVDLLSGWCKP